MLVLLEGRHNGVVGELQCLVSSDVLNQNIITISIFSPNFFIIAFRNGRREPRPPETFAWVGFVNGHCDFVLTVFNLPLPYKPLRLLNVPPPR